MSETKDLTNSKDGVLLDKTLRNIPTPPFGPESGGYAGRSQRSVLGGGKRPEPPDAA